MAEILVNLSKVGVTFASRDIFHDVEWEIQLGQRIGLVGPNGAGKSTLLKLIDGALPVDSGAIFRAAGLTCARLEQQPSFEPGATIWDELRTAVPELPAIEQQLAALEHQMGDPAVYGDAAVLERTMAGHERLLRQYADLDGPRYEARLKEMLTRLGFAPETWYQPVGQLSGGQKKLLALAKLALLEPKLLLLDEPDNHLDIPAKRALEKFIAAYKGSVVIISHDRYLLDEVVDHIAELENGRLSLYGGNYSAYSAERELRRLRQQQLYAAQQKEIARIEAAIARFEKWASLVVNERHIRQARSRQKMLDRLDRVEKVNGTRRMNLELAGWRGSNKVIELEDLRKTFSDGVTLWQGLNHTIWHGERVGLVGPNGAGKSMLLKQLLQPESVSGGWVRLGPSISIGYFDQEHDNLDHDRTLIDEVRQVAQLSRESAVAYLNRYLFTYEQMTGPIRYLSGGERSRLQLAKIVLGQPNLLLLDEPTNNLDIVSIEVLEETLEEFTGTVVVISHDRYFLDKVVDRVIELRDGALNEYAGGYTDYLAQARGED